MHKILIGAPVRQDAAILYEFLQSLRELDRSGLDVDFAFVDDNVEAASSQLLRDFAAQECTLLLAAGNAPEVYAKDEFGHVWNDELIWKVARFKDRILDHARTSGHDGVFLVDSDLVLHPNTLRQLIAARVDITAEVFWTRWSPQSADRPQVWLSGQDSMHTQRSDEVLSQDESERRRQQFFHQLLRPGLHAVGGLGACTLISRRALLAGVDFRSIPNLGFWGEDRHFCVRAVVLGLQLHADTCYPPLHVYRQSELSKVAGFRAGRTVQAERVAALDGFREGITAWGTSHYATMTGIEGHEFLTPVLRAALAPGAPERVAMASRTLNVTRTHVVWVSQKDLDSGAMEIGATLVREGSIAGQPFTDHLGVLATMQRAVAGADWQIANLQLQRLNDPVQIPIVRRTRNNRVLLSMIVKDEADRFLPTVLDHAASYVDEVLILDDGSADATVDVCRRILRNVPHTIVELGESKFHEEHQLRRMQWELARARRCDWILCLDADEMFEARMVTEMRSLIDQDAFDAIAFRLFDFWDQDHYRDDALWRAHRTFRPFLVRALPTLGDAFLETPQHCGRWPLDVARLRTATSDLRLKHLGWSRPDDRRRKFERYRELDPEGRCGSLMQYESILDPSPCVVRWQE